jgi:hypothetical protein
MVAGISSVLSAGLGVVGRDRRRLTGRVGATTGAVLLAEEMPVGGGAGVLEEDAVGAGVMGSAVVIAAVTGGGGLACGGVSFGLTRRPATKPPTATTPMAKSTKRNVRSGDRRFSRPAGRVETVGSRIELGSGSIAAGVTGSATPRPEEETPDGGSGAVFGPPLETGPWLESGACSIRLETGPWLEAGPVMLVLSVRSKSICGA